MNVPGHAMKICYLDAFSGISGDMLVGALADAGADQTAIAAAIASLDAGATVSFERVKRCGIAATKYRVAVEEAHAHRPLAHILEMIGGAEIPPRAKHNAQAVFRKEEVREALTLPLEILGQ